MTSIKVGDTVRFKGSTTSYNVKAKKGVKYKVVRLANKYIYIKLPKHASMDFYLKDFEKVNNKIKLYKLILDG